MKPDMMKVFRSDLGLFVLFVTIGLGIYANSLGNGFHFDDNHHILKNPFLRTPGNIPLFFTDPRAFTIFPGLFNHYRPLVLTSYSLNYWWGGLNPMGYHLVNLAFHIGSAFLIFLIVRLMLTGASLLPPLTAGLIFLTTPFNSEVVNYISARSSVMASFFYLLSFYFWVRYREVGRPSASRFYLFSLLAFFLSMVTKEIAVTLPVMLWLYDLYFKGKGSRLAVFQWRSYLPYTPFLAAGLFFGPLIRRIFFENVMGWSGGSRDPWVHLLMEVRSLAKYAYLTLWPIGLNLSHEMDEIGTIYDLRVVLSSLFVVLLLVSAWGLWKKGGTVARSASFFVLWFFIALLPTSIVPLSAVFQENRGYLPAVGIVVAAALAVDSGIRFFGRRRVPSLSLGYALIGLVIVAYSVGVVERNGVWKNDYTLWTDSVQKNPSSQVSHVELGRYYFRMGRMGEAEGEFLRVLQINPQNPHALTNLGLLYADRGEKERAKEMWEEALRYFPDYPDARRNLAAFNIDVAGDLQAGEMELQNLLAVESTDPSAVRKLIVDVYERRGEFDRIRGKILELAQRDPSNPAVRFGMGMVYERAHQWEKAKDEFLGVLRRVPNDMTTLLELVSVYTALGDQAGVEKTLEEARETEPESPMLHQTMGIYYQQNRRYPEAIQEYEKVLRTNAGSFRVYSNLGVVYFLTGQPAKAEESLRKAIQINPEDPGSHYNLAKIYDAEGKRDLAKREYQWIVDRAPGSSTALAAFRVDAEKRLAAIR